MFEEISLAFNSKYRVSATEPTSSRTLSQGSEGDGIGNGGVQEQWDSDLREWTPCDDALPHTLRAYMATFLSANPRHRFGLTTGFDLEVFSSRIWNQ
jgi:hypothetical protein